MCAHACWYQQLSSCFLHNRHVSLVCAMLCVLACVTQDSQALLSVTKCLTALKPLTCKYTGHTAVDRQHARQLLSDLHHHILCHSNMICKAVVLYSSFIRSLQIFNRRPLVGLYWQMWWYISQQ